MYSEQHTVGHRAGIHAGTLDAFATHFPAGLVTINGIDPTDVNSTLDLMRIEPGHQVDVGANTGDDQRDRDLVHIARGIIEHGGNPWRVQAPVQPRLPMERYNQAANALRQRLGLPQEGPMQVVTHEKKEVSAAVSGDMTAGVKSSKWQVIALGELQQPGGVGATQPYNPVVDGPNPDGADLSDNAGNSPEQEVALQTWVNTAIDLLNRGEQQDAIIAKLAHDGCPNPQEVLQRAMQQPEHSPISDEIGQDPFEAPAPPDPSQNGEMQGLSQQPPVQAAVKNADLFDFDAEKTPTEDFFDFDAEKTPEDLFDVDGPPKTKNDLFDVSKEDGADNHVPPVKFKEKTPVQETHDVHAGRVRIAGTTMIGTELDRWEDMWGQGTVKVALDDGGTVNVSPDALVPVDGDLAVKHPVSEIQQFIDTIPKVEPTRPHIEARLANLELVRRAVRANISKVGFSDQEKLVKMDSDAANETAVLQEILSNFHEGFELAYAKTARKYEMNAFHLGNPHIKPWGGHPKEAGAIWANENFTTVVTDKESFVAAAAHYAHNLGMTGTQFKDFLAGAEEHRQVRTEEFVATEPETTENEGPAEALFV